MKTVNTYEIVYAYQSSQRAQEVGCSTGVYVVLAGTVTGGQHECQEPFETLAEASYYAKGLGLEPNRFSMDYVES